MKITRSADLSRLVRDRRDELGLTQQQVAEHAGVTRQLIARVENGAGDPSVRTLLRILDALRVDLHMGAAGETVPSSPRAAAPLQLAVPVPALDVSGLAARIDGWKQSARDVEPRASRTSPTDRRET